ncbi:MAG: nuclease-related domain-containing protein [Gaiellaceae bacterium]
MGADLAGMAYEVTRRPGAFASGREGRHLLVGIAAALIALFASLGVVLWSSALWVSLLLLIVAVPLLKHARQRERAADRWGKGWRAEARVGAVIESLRPDGFVAMHDIVPHGRGNVDHLVRGPNGVFLIETKHRRYLDPDLGKVKRQAARLHDELGSWVTPAIALATRRRVPFKHAGVWVIDVDHLADWLRSQRGTPCDFERFARLADRL